MKRSPIEYPRVKQIKPILFWYKCRFCNREFKKESGYQIEEKGYANQSFYSYCCNECGSSVENVKYKLIEFKNRYKLLKHPPKQPKVSS